MMQPQHEYATVQSHEQHDDDSSTEVESLVGAEKQWVAGEDFQNNHQRPRIRPLLPQILATFRWVLIIGLQIIIIGLLAREQNILGTTRWRGRSTSADQVGGDITGWGPHIPTQITQFHINQTFAPWNTSDFFKPETLRAWNELLPIGMGFQSIPPTTLSTLSNLPTPIIWPNDFNNTVFTTSMTHQLHCLYAVVAVYSGLTSNNVAKLEKDYHWHMIHCFDYMRQAIMCSADMAMEGLETTFPDHNGGSDGWDSRHVCRDQGVVRGWLEGVRAYDDQQIY